MTKDTKNRIKDLLVVLHLAEMLALAMRRGELPPMETIASFADRVEATMIMELQCLTEEQEDVTPELLGSMMIGVLTDINQTCKKEGVIPPYVIPSVQ